MLADARKNKTLDTVQRKASSVAMLTEACQDAMLGKNISRSDARKNIRGSEADFVGK